MSADDELPRGWTQVTNATNAAVTITYPAIPGIAWTLTEIAGRWWCNSAYGAAAVFQVQVNGVTYDVDAAPGAIAVGQGGSLSWSGQETFPTNTAVTIILPVAQQAIDFTFSITASAYPI